MTSPRIVLSAVIAGSLLSACQTPPSPAAAPPVSAPEPAPEPPPPEPPPPPPPPPPVTPATQQQAQRIALASAVLLEAGREDQAKGELQRALVADPNNKLALNLMRQINAADPVALLGRDSFSYTVRPNDTLSTIAGRFLGDIYSFYILARYNNIAVPRQVAGGQTLRIPGKAPPTPREPRSDPPPKSPPLAGLTPTLPPQSPPPPPTSPPPPPPAEPPPGLRAMRDAEAAERAGNLERALADYRKAAGLDQPGAQAKADALRKQLVVRHSTAAKTAFAKQDLDGAIKAWDRVLDIDPDNNTAKIDRQRAQALKERASKL